MNFIQARNLFCPEALQSASPPQRRPQVGVVYANRREVLKKAKLRRSSDDPALAYDPRVLKNMLHVERVLAPMNDYFSHLQTEVRPWMRLQVVKWMAEVCAEQKCEAEVFPLALNYMDRVLSQRRIRKTNLQQLAAASMLLASKLKETLAVSVQQLAEYTDFSVTMSEILSCESFIVVTLDFQLAAVTPHDFIHILVHHCDLLSSLPPGDLYTLKKEAQIFAITAIQCDEDLSFQTPSIVAVCALCLIVADMFNREKGVEILEDLSCLMELPDTVLVKVHNCLQVMGSNVEKYYRKLNCGSSGFKENLQSGDIPSRQSTPTNIQHIHAT